MLLDEDLWVGPLGSRGPTAIRISQRSLAVTAACTDPNLARLELPRVSDIGTRTKIVCTLGPSSDTTAQVGKLVEAGMTVARLNFSHAGSDYSYADSNLGLVRQALGHHAQLAVLPGSTSSTSTRSLPPNLRAVLVDTKGPEVRTGPLPGGVDVLEIPTNAVVELHTDPDKVTVDTSGEDVIRLLVDYTKIAQTVQPGGQVLLDDGLIALQVEECHPDSGSGGGYVTCRALNAGPIKPNKGVNLPGCTLDLPALTDKDKRDLEWAGTYMCHVSYYRVATNTECLIMIIEHVLILFQILSLFYIWHPPIIAPAVKVGADYVAASFIRTPDNVRSVVAYLERCIANLPEDSQQSQSAAPPPGHFQD